MDEAPPVVPFSHCAHCGHRFRDGAGWPRTCGACGHVSYRNPAPVVVLAVPVDDAGVLMVRRVQPPEGLALPSGYIDHGERWQDAAARELAEETGIRMDAADIRELTVRSGDDGTLLVFATAPPVPRSALDAFVPSAEVSELAVVAGPRADVVFPLDLEVVASLCVQAGAGAAAARTRAREAPSASSMRITSAIHTSTKPARRDSGIGSP